ncbi:MAG TPA: hypothetical protein VH134_08225 [Candidatus Dormibacteraeota bacterium]|nr:hypothetical protein [Candidatus Dormibacteraeota bacterium]
MPVFIVGHGGLASDRPQTIVPPGQSITFYTDVDLNLVMSNGMAAVMSGDASSGSETVQGGDPVPNYGLGRLTDNQRVRFETVAQAGGTFLYIGDQLPDGIHLCDGDDTMCNEGHHICGGVFGRVEDAEMIYIACRGVDGGLDVNQEAYGGTGDASLSQGLDAVYNQLMGVSEEERGRYINQLEDARTAESQEALAFLMNYPDLRKAAYKQRTAEYLASSDPLTFESMFFSQPDTEQAWMREVPGVEEALTDAARQRMFAGS